MNNNLPVKINLCSSGGEVTNPKTWSGTPFNIYSQMKKMEAVGITFSLNDKLFSKRVLRLLSFFYYFNDQDAFRGKIARYINSKIVAKTIKNASSKHTLHFGTLGFSMSKFPKEQSDYIYIDSTWNLRSNQAAFIEKYSERLKNDSEELEAESFKQGKHIFTISKYVKDNLVNHYSIPESKITVVGTGVGVIKPFFGDKDYTNGKILFVAKGRFEDKGGQLVIEAFKKALEKQPNLQLSIVGQKSYSEIVQHPQIKTYGFLPLEELQALFETHSLFLMPAFYEPWGLVYLEALISKMPIVGLNRNSFPELSNYGEFGFGLNEPDADQLAQTLNYAFENPELLKKMGEAGQKYCMENFTWEVSVKKIVDKINELSFEHQ